MFCNNPSPTNNRLVQVSEQAFDPVRVPVVIGNEVFLLTQQDVRNIIDTRYISLTKLYDNGLGNRPADGVLQGLGATMQYLINNAINMNQIIQPNQQGYLDPAKHFENLNQNLFPNANVNQCPPPTSTVAPIQVQLDWEMKDVQNEQPAQSQFTYCKNASTADLRSIEKKVRFADQVAPTFICGAKRFICRGTNVADDDFTEESSTEPGARELLKKKKINESMSL